MTIRPQFSRTPEFWAWMGPAFASQAVRRELPSLHDTGEYLWFLALENQDLRGFGALRVRGDTGYLRHLYVYSEYRRRGIGTALVSARLKYLADLPEIARIQVSAGPLSISLYLRLGYRVTGFRGRYAQMELLCPRS